jgi:hypothetical protein
MSFRPWQRVQDVLREQRALDVVEVAAVTGMRE